MKLKSTSFVLMSALAAGVAHGTGTGIPPTAKTAEDANLNTVNTTKVGGIPDGDGASAVQMQQQAASDGAGVQMDQTAKGIAQVDDDKTNSQVQQFGAIPVDQETTLKQADSGATAEAQAV